MNKDDFCLQYVLKTAQSTGLAVSPFDADQAMLSALKAWNILRDSDKTDK